jgi:hypothetical protein
MLVLANPTACPKNPGARKDSGARWREKPGGFRREDPTKVSYPVGRQGNVRGLCRAHEALSRHPGLFAIPGVAPGVRGLVR